MKILVFLLLILSAIQHIRLTGIISFGQEFNAIVLFVGMVLYIRQLVKDVIIPFSILSFFFLYSLIGVINNNQEYYIFKDFIQLISMAGFFLYGYDYFRKKTDDEFSKFLFDSSVFLVITFIAVYVSLYLYHISIKQTYFQVQQDIIFLVSLAIFQKKYIPVAIVVSFLSLKRMFTVTTLLVFFSDIIKQRLVVLLALIVTIYFGIELNALNKIVGTYEMITHAYENIDIYDKNEILEVLFQLDRVRVGEFVLLLDKFDLQSFIFGQGMGGGVIERELVTGDIESVSFIHILPLSLIIKFGVFGVLFIGGILVYIIYRSPRFRLNLLKLFSFSILASFFAAYLIASWAFWLCFGAALGASRNKLKRLKMISHRPEIDGL